MSETLNGEKPSMLNNLMGMASEALGKIFIKQNLTSLANGTNETEKFKATPEGLCLAYTSLVIMALIPIILGSFKSVKHQKKQHESGEEIETMSTKEALMFPLIASVTLFSIYVIFQIFSKDHINLLLAFYFFLLGVIALTRMFSPIMTHFWPSFLVEHHHFDLNFSLTKKSTKTHEKSEVCGVSHGFGTEMPICFLLALAIGVWYFMKKHWIANNIFGLAFAVNGIEFLQLNKVVNGCILLGGLFLYDVFWVFGTNVMVTVAKSFDAPIKLIFPQDLIEHGIYADKYALLGLGDIVIPGIFIALLLRFDMSLNRNSKIYFYSSFVAYVLALFCTIFVMHVFKHAQPALLYIVPLCVLIPLFVALIKGDLKKMFTYRDHEESEAKAAAGSDESLNTSKSNTENDNLTDKSASTTPASSPKTTKEAKKTK